MKIEEELRIMFGSEKVDHVKYMVLISDPDFAYSFFEDQGDEDACSIIESLYFDLEN